MNKTININLSGIVFHLDEQAYEAFKTYLSQVKQALSGQEGGTEIIADIEARIAELFSQRLESFKRSVVITSDIFFIIDTLGRPEEFKDDVEPEHTDPETPKTQRRFFRNSEEQFIGGVASGIGAYFGIETVWIRIIFLVLLFFTGIGLITYIILWAAIPEAKTTAQKLQMKGEPVNLSNIEKSVKEELDGVKDRFSKFRDDNKGSAGKINSAAHRFFSFILNIIEGIARFIFKFLSIILIIIASFIGFFVFVGLLGMVGSSWNINITGFDFISYGGHILGLNGAEAILGSGLLLNLIRIGTLLTLLFPIFGLIVLLAKSFKRPIPNAKRLTLVGGISFIIGLILIIYSGITVASSFDVKATEMGTVALKGHQFDLQADLLEDSDPFLFEIDDDKLRIENVKLNVKKSFDSIVTLVIKHQAYGKNNSDARNRAQRFDYPIDQTGSILSLNEYFTVPKDALYRGQELKATLYLPIGSIIFLDPSVENLIDDVENIYDMADREMIGHTWEMRNTGLTCLDCQDVQKYYNEDEVSEAEDAIEKVNEELKESENNIEQEIERLEQKLRSLKYK